MVNGNKGTFGGKIEKKLKASKCSKCGRFFTEPKGINCPFCGDKLKSVKIIKW